MRMLEWSAQGMYVSVAPYTSVYVQDFRPASVSMNGSAARMSTAARNSPPLGSRGSAS